MKAYGVVRYNSILKAYGVVRYNSIMKAYAFAVPSQPGNAEILLGFMEEDGVEPNIVTYNNLIRSNHE